MLRLRWVMLSKVSSLLGLTLPHLLRSHQKGLHHFGHVSIERLNELHVLLLVREPHIHQLHRLLQPDLLKHINLHFELLSKLHSLWWYQFPLHSILALLYRSLELHRQVDLFVRFGWWNNPSISSQISTFPSQDAVLRPRSISAVQHTPAFHNHASWEHLAIFRAIRIS